jgi:predicted esterase
MKRLLSAVSFFLIFLVVSAQVKTIEYAQRDTCKLYMDVYNPKGQSDGMCVIYAFGGAFKMGDKTDKVTVSYMEKLSQNGITAIAINYRLGMKGDAYELKGMKLLNRYADAIRMATEDMLTASRYVYDHAIELGVDPNKIVLSGSSAGAMTALQCDFELSNNTQLGQIMPDGFRFGGVIPFAGAVSVLSGKIEYKQTPAPTLFFHGTEDVLVPYNKISMFGKGMYGSAALAKIFKKHEYPFGIIRYEHFGHEIASIPMHENISEILRFLDTYVRDKRAANFDLTIHEMAVTKPMLDFSIRSINKMQEIKISKEAQSRMNGDESR